MLLESFYAHCSRWDGGARGRLFSIADMTALAAIGRHALSTTLAAAREGVLGHVEVREVSDRVIGGIVHSTAGSSHVCRFSLRTDPAGVIDGPMCSCGSPISDDGILCTHLVALGVAAATEHQALADFVVPLALSEASPLSMLVRLGLVEGGESGALRPTALGRTVCRLYLRPTTLREVLPLMSVVDSADGLVALLRHMVALETGQRVDDQLQQALLMAVTTRTPLDEVAEYSGVSYRDLVSLMDTSRWLTYSIAGVADVTGMARVAEMARRLFEDLEVRLRDDSSGDVV